MSDKRITVIGGVNVDIFGTSDEPLILYDSNPGKCLVSFGGVGRNIAEDLARLGVKTDMITVLGDDLYSRELVSYSKTIGIDFSNSLFLPDTRCSTYTCINNRDGEMVLAISDMSSLDKLTPDVLEERLDHINSASLVVVDTNISEDSLRYLSENVTAPMLLDTVSTHKAVRVKSFIGRFDTIKPNIYEAEVLALTELKSDESIIKCAEYFHQQGVRQVFISLGERGVYYSGENDKGFISTPRGFKAVNVAGCGDAFLAAVAYTMLDDGSIRDMAVAGEAAAAICSLSSKTISPELTEEHLKEFLHFVK